MTDLWYIFGAMVADPDFFNLVKKQIPGFTRIKMMVTENTDPAHQRKAAGYLDATSTSNMRWIMRDYVVANFSQPPVISLYSAARFCQMIVTAPNLTAALTVAQQAFKTAGGQKSSSPALLTLVGICLLDAQLASWVVTNMPQPGDISKVQPSTEFGLNPAGAEFQVVQKLTKDQTFGDATADLMQSDCWTTAPCRESFAFYDDFKRAVN